VRERQRGPVPTEACWQEFYQAAQWLKANAGPNDVVLSAKMPLVWFWTGLRGVPVPMSPDGPKAAEALDKADWLIVDDLGEGNAAARFAARALHGQAASWAWAWEQGRTAIVRRKPRAAE
jgi:hypothetical protein